MNLSQRIAFNTILLTTGRLAIAATGLVGVAVATRYLGPEDFGDLTIGLVFVSVFVLLTDAGLYTIAAREIAKRPHEEQHIIANVFSMGLILSLGVVLLALGMMFLLYGGDERTLVREGILIIGTQLLVAAPGGVAVSFMTAHQRAIPAAVGGGVSSLVFMVVLIAAVELDLGFGWIAAAYGISAVLNTLIPVAFGLPHMTLRFSRDRELWREILRWTIPQGAVLVLAVIYFRVDTFLLSFLGDDIDVALYGVGYKIVETLLLVPTYFMLTLFPELARAAGRSERLGRLMQGAWSSFLVAAGPLLVLFAGFAPEIVEIAGGEEFDDAVPVLQVLIVATAFAYGTIVFFQALVALNLQRRLVQAQLAVLAFNVVINFALIPAAGALGAAISLVVSEALLLVLVRRMYEAAAPAPSAQNVGAIVAATVAMAAVVAGLRALAGWEDAALPLLAGALPALAVYALALRALGGVPREFSGLRPGAPA